MLSLPYFAQSRIWILAVGLAVALSGHTPRAQARAIPSTSATSDPRDISSAILPGSASTSPKNESHVMLLYDNADVGNAGTFKSLSVRAPFRLFLVDLATAFELTLTMSNSLVPHAQANSTFARNHGARPTVVFQGKANLPTRNAPPPLSWPQPWDSLAVFARPFVYRPAPGGSLAIELTASKSTSAFPWFMEAHAPRRGLRSTTVFACRNHSDGNRNGGLSFTFASLGRTWSVSHMHMPSNVPSLRMSVNVVGLQGPGGTAFGLQLPVPITRLGLPDACRVAPGQLANDAAILLPMRYRPRLAGGKSLGHLDSPPIRIPNDQRLNNVVFFSQPLCVDTNPQTRQLEAYMGWGSKWTIQDNRGLPSTMVSHSGDNSIPTGRTFPFAGVTLQLR